MRTSKRISALTNTGKSAINYSYDSLGNISVITQGSDRIEYYYDGLSQLVRENYSVGSTNYTRTFTYDAGGNIQNRNNYPYATGNGTLGTPTSTDSYGYDTTWHDKLVSFNGQSISYDAIGNPTSYLGKTLTWTMGRQLESLSDASNSVQYTYNENGIRTKKTVNGTTTTYHLVGDVVTMEQTGSQTPIYYAYDGSGNLFLINYGGQNYFYVRNAQNDIIGLVDTSGNWVVEYQYDAWGKLLGTSGTLANTLGQANPYRYRGYRYDAETGLYTLSSRYYDPQVGRFINADDSDVLDGSNDHLLENNLFAYCLNNPVNHTDEDGQWPKWATKVAIGIGVIAICAAVTVITGGAGAGVAGFIAAGALNGAIGGAVSGAAIGAGVGAVGQRLQTGSWKGAGKAALNGGADGFMYGAISGAITSGGGRAIQALRNTKVTSSSLPKTSKPMTSLSKVKNGKVSQTRFYNSKGNGHFDLDYTTHGTPNIHTNPHGHVVNVNRSQIHVKLINKWR